MWDFDPLPGLLGYALIFAVCAFGVGVLIGRCI